LIFSAPPVPAFLKWAWRRQVHSVRELAIGEFDLAVGIVARAMHDNPLTIQVFGDDPVGRLRAGERLHRPLMRSVMDRGGLLCAEHLGAVVGVLGMATRKLTFLETMKLVPAIFIGFSPGVMVRVGRWLSEWDRREPHEPYWHLGPVAVEPALQGQALGSALMADFCARVDERGALAYLEADKLVNVKFYRKFGFETIGEAKVIGVSNWFMARQPMA
jgi:ribosomal protein S18 acetylase RimI-like enzyme